IANSISRRLRNRVDCHRWPNTRQGSGNPTATSGHPDAREGRQHKSFHCRLRLMPISTAVDVPCRRDLCPGARLRLSDPAGVYHCPRCMKSRTSVMVPVACAIAYGAARVVAGGDPPLFHVVTVLLAKTLALVGCVAAATRFERGDRMRTIWSLFVLDFALLIV